MYVYIYIYVYTHRCIHIHLSSGHAPDRGTGHSRRRRAYVLGVSGATPSVREEGAQGHSSWGVYIYIYIYMNVCIHIYIYIVVYRSGLFRAIASLCP